LIFIINVEIYYLITEIRLPNKSTPLHLGLVILLKKHHLFTAVFCWN